MSGLLPHDYGDAPVAFNPDWCVHPGGTLQDWCDENHVSPRVGAVACGIERAKFERLLAGKEKITKPIAVKLARGTGIPAFLWLNLERQFRRGLAEGKTWTP